MAPISQPTENEHRNPRAVSPIYTGGAPKTSNKALVATVRKAGWRSRRDSPHTNERAFILPAKDQGAVALLAFDDDHGLFTASFHRWDGSKDGDDALELHCVDPDLYAATMQLLVDAYADDHENAELLDHPQFLMPAAPGEQDTTQSEPSEGSGAASVPVSGFGPHAPPTLANASKMVEAGRVLRGGILHMAFDAGGALLVLAGGRIERLDPNTLQPTGHWLDGRGVTHFQSTASDRILVSIADRDEDVLAWGEFGQELIPFYRLKGLRSLATAADGNTIAISTRESLLLLDATGAVRTRFEVPSNENPHVSISPSGRHVGGHGRIWVDGVVRTSETKTLVEGEWQASMEPERFLDVRVLSDEYFSGSRRIYSFTTDVGVNAGEDAQRAIATADRFVLPNGYGGYHELDARTLAAIESAPGFDEHYGAQSDLEASALSSEHLALYAPTYGVLTVVGAGTTTQRRGYLAAVEDLTVSSSGRRLVVQSKFRGCVHAIDLDGGETSITAGDVPISAAISDDGSSVLRAVGPDGKPMTMEVSPFSGGHAVVTHKSEKYATTLAFSGDRYLHAARKLESGWIGLFEVGKKRAVAKVPVLAHGLSVSGDGTAAVVTSRVKRQWAAHVLDLEKKMAELETIPGAVHAALGHDRETLACLVNHDGGATLHMRTAAGSVEREWKPWEVRAFAFSADGSALFVAGPHLIHVLDPRTGEEAHTIQTGVVPTSLFVRGGLLWLLGEYGEILAYASSPE